MKNTKLAEAIQKRLKKAGVIFEGKDLEHGVQFRFRSGAILNVFRTGKIQWQGAYADREEAIDDLLSDAIRDIHGPGLFGRKP